MPYGFVQKSKVAVVAGFLALGLFFHLYRLGDFPGVHFDEAFAASLADRIRALGLSLSGQSSYTAPLGHLSALLWGFGTDVERFRLSQMLWPLLGLALAIAALLKHGERRVAVFFAVLFLILPSLVLNHRFAIEVTTFHTFCWILLLVSGGRAWLAVLASVLGILSHILFVAPVCAALGTAVLTSERSWHRATRVWVSGAALGFTAYFLWLSRRIPENDKAYALVGLSLVAGGVALIQPKLAGLRLRMKLKGWVAHPWASVLAFFPIAIFYEGMAGILFQQGQFAFPYAFLGISAITALLLLQARIRDDLRIVFVLLVIALSCVAIKPAPRYFETAYVALACMSAYGFTRRLGLAGVSAISILSSVILLSNAYRIPEGERDVSLRLAGVPLYRDTNRDHLSKQAVARWLTENGCDLSQIQTEGDRLALTLDWLRRSGYTPVPFRTCPYRTLKVVTEKDYEAGATGIRVTGISGLFVLTEDR